MSDCGCVYTSYDGDHATVHSEEIVKARKAHRCCECRETIPIGAAYELYKGCWEGVWQTYRTCRACREIRALLCCEGWNFTALWEDVREYFSGGGNPLGCINKLESVDARDKLAAEYRDFLGLTESAPRREAP